MLYIKYLYNWIKKYGFVLYVFPSSEEYYISNVTNCLFLATPSTFYKELAIRNYWINVAKLRKTYGSYKNTDLKEYYKKCEDMTPKYYLSKYEIERRKAVKAKTS